MSPGLRRALHQALDIVCDALAAEASEQPAKVKRRRGPVIAPLLPAVELPPALQAQLDRQLERAGYKKTG